MDKTDIDESGIWALYGFKTNPFSTSPLLVKGGLIPIECFIGRKEELDSLVKMFHSGGGSRNLVCGDIGVGKTTLVNVARADVISKGYFSPFEEIGVQKNWDADLFILNTLYRIYATIAKLKEKPISDENYKKLQNLLELNNSQISGLGINVGIIGANFSQTTNPTQKITNVSIFDFFKDLIAEIRTNSKRDVVIHYNNLENIPEKKIRELFEDLRDFFQTPHTHFVFVGNLTVYSIFQSMPRFSSILSDIPIVINEMSIKEVKELLKLRYEKLRINKDLKYIIPFEEEVLTTLFELYSGNIRDILNSIQSAVLGATSENPIILNKESLGQVLSGKVRRGMLYTLQPRAVDVLLEVLKHDEITNKGIADSTKIARSNVSTYLGDLENAGCVRLKRQNGKDKYWSVEPKMKWLLLGNKEAKASMIKKLPVTDSKQKKFPT